jgi:hypothetical protein
MENKRIFRNNATGQTITIIDMYGNIAIDDNRNRHDTGMLLNPLMYTEQEGPTSVMMKESTSYDSERPPILDDSVTLNVFTQLLSNVDTTQLSDRVKGSDVEIRQTPGYEPVVRGAGNNFPGNYPASSGYGPVSNESAIVAYDEDEERRALMAKYGAVSDRPVVTYKDEDEMLDSVIRRPELKTDKKDVNPEQPSRPYVEPVYREPVYREETMDPMVQLFKNTKRALPFHFTIPIEEKIPRLDFIEMMEDSYERSIIDYLADEFTQKILNDPGRIRQMLVTELRRLALKEDPSEEVENVTEPMTEYEVNIEIIEEQDETGSDVVTPGGEYEEGIPEPEGEGK